MAAPNRLLSGIMTVGGWTMASRILGFARDVMIAAFLGAGPVAEAFLVAFSLPNMFRRFFAEGAFNTAFVPMFSKKVEAGEDAAAFARQAFSALAAILVVFSVVAIVAMPALVVAMASGFLEDERFPLAVAFGRIAFPYILLVSLAALVSGVLNSVGRFTAAAAAPVLLNIVFIAAIWLGARVFDIHEAGPPGVPDDTLTVGYVLAWAVPLGGLIQLGLVWWAAARAGFPMVPGRPRITPELRRLAAIAAPAALAGGVVQVNLLVGRQVASFFDGAIAWLSYADRLYQLPLGVVGIAIGVVLLPELSRRLRAGDAEGGRWAFNRAGEIALALSIPATVALVAMPGALVSVLFGRGAFDAGDVAATSLAVVIYALGLPAFVIQKVLQPLFFAREDTRSPFRYALWSMAVNVGVALGLAPAIGWPAAALGTTLAAWAMAALLWRGSRGMGAEAALDDRFAARLWRIVAASLVMGAVLAGSVWAASGLLADAGWRVLALAGIVVVGAVVYFAAGIAFGAFSRADLKGAVRRG